MTPLEKAKAAEGRVNYCDECESFVILNDAPYCKVDGKLIHPIMLIRGQGTGPAWNCKKRRKPLTNYEKLISKTPEEMVKWIESIEPAACPFRDDHGDDCRYTHCEDCWLDWLKKEAEA